MQTQFAPESMQIRKLTQSYVHFGASMSVCIFRGTCNNLLRPVIITKLSPPSLQSNSNLPLLSSYVLLVLICAWVCLYEFLVYCACFTHCRFFKISKISAVTSVRQWAGAEWGQAMEMLICSRRLWVLTNKNLNMCVYKYLHKYNGS